MKALYLALLVHPIALLLIWVFERLQAAIGHVNHPTPPKPPMRGQGTIVALRALRALVMLAASPFVLLDLIETGLAKAYRGLTESIDRREAQRKAGQS